MVNINFSGLEIDQHSIVFVWSQYDGVNIVPDNEQSDISGPGSKVERKLITSQWRLLMEKMK